MEWIWFIIAALGAGIGTGLAGLSAATVMVPVLIVLCPSFSGETGAYQATAIALASDILGSAVTTYTYAKHRKIDLKRGFVMLVCILTMCTVGSYVAFLAGNVVLGSFTLFLTFFIGIRFLVKPDTSRENTAGRGEKLDVKGIAISLFFGLTIGFGTGFVGTGGGMMMLVVFTAFLGMELKTAVGTSTFIMTFTALIASVSHILIHPAILLEKWNVMLLCITVATAASLFSAGFANRVNNRTVGLVTGAVLTVLGGSMLLLNFWLPWQADPVHYPMCAGPAADSFSHGDSVLCLSEAAAYRGIHLLRGHDADRCQVAGRGADIPRHGRGDLSAAYAGGERGVVWEVLCREIAGRNQAEPSDAVLYVCGGDRSILGHFRESAYRSRFDPDVGNGRRIRRAGRYPVWKT